MKITHIITGLNTGGAETVLCRLVESLSPPAFEHDVVALGADGALSARVAKSVGLRHLGMRTALTSVPDLWRLRAFLRSQRPDVVQGWMYHGNLAAMMGVWAARLTVPVAWNVRQSLYDLTLEKRGTRAVIRANRFHSTRPAAIIYNSALSRGQHENFGFEKKRGQVVPNGFDLARWRPSRKSRQTLRLQLRIPEDALLVGHIARYHPMKNHKIYLRALQTVAARYPQAHFLMMGRDVEARNPALSALFHALPVNRLHTLGERSDIEHLMPALDLFCLSSSGEAFPNVLGEAMACAVPCVSTAVGDSAAIVGDTGFIVPPGDTVALARALSRMLSKSAGERRALGEAARERIRANYSLDAKMKHYSELYEKLAFA